MMNDISDFKAVCEAAKRSSVKLAALPDDLRTGILLEIAAELDRAADAVLSANREDCRAAEADLKSGEMTQALYNRLKLTPEKAGGLSVYAKSVSALSGSLNTVDYACKLDDGLVLERIRCPLGLIAAIYESRPEVTVQVSCLALKSGNAVILKGGREALHSNRVLFGIIRDVLAGHKLADCVVLAENREQIRQILTMKGTVDMIIPRGSNTFVQYIRDHSAIPVLGHADGICHIYLDEGADPVKAVRIITDAKLSYPAACNAVETLLCHPASEQTTTAELLDREGIAYHPAHDNTWRTEYSGPGLSVKQVSSIDEAIRHINTYGSGHTDAIITENDLHAAQFIREVDAASVFHNASTRFADGYVFGLGAEVGISTEKIHARGPVGIEGLLTTKYVLRGAGHARSDYTDNPERAKDGQKNYTHQPLRR
ncbi:hypothetical protein CHS0354_018437 [Potamilus streckersoni]|uniref:glutamate-5-semialdehyde dehydrogenase n=1 Tax=Potamilus streckersoni TaxID=2493646 RepID=A0AAE0TB93_9BIVA|nr:hypothetical protein CHS0354_018437 [Potamilus streckersoni]